MRHTRRGLVAVLLHALPGLVVLAVSVTPGVVSLQSSHTSLCGLVVLRGIHHAWRGLVAVFSHP